MGNRDLPMKQAFLQVRFLHGAFVVAPDVGRDSTLRRPDSALIDIPLRDRHLTPKAKGAAGHF